MATGLDCGDEYDDRQSCYYRYSMAIGDGFREPDAPDNPYDFLATAKQSRLAEQGNAVFVFRRSIPSSWPGSSRK